MTYWPAPPPTRIISWQQVVIENDPNWQRNYTRPMNYEFSNGRLFYQFPPIYGLPVPAVWDGPLPWDTPGVTWDNS